MCQNNNENFLKDNWETLKQNKIFHFWNYVWNNNRRFIQKIFHTNIYFLKNWAIINL